MPAPLRVEEALRTYTKQHSRTYIRLAEWVLKQFVPESSQSSARREWVFDQTLANAPVQTKRRNSESSLTSSFTSAKTLPNRTVEQLRKAGNLRKLRAFCAMIDHHVFKGLPEAEQSKAGEIMHQKMNEVFAEICKTRLGEGWEQRHRRFREMTFYFPQRANKSSWRGVTSDVALLKLEASRLLERVDDFGRERPGSLENLRTALRKYLDDPLHGGSTPDNSTVNGNTSGLAQKPL